MCVANRITNTLLTVRGKEPDSQLQDNACYTLLKDASLTKINVMSVGVEVMGAIQNLGG